MSIEFEARAEAEKRYTSREWGDGPGSSTWVAADRPRIEAFMAGVEWQTTRPVTDAEADAACIAFHEYVVGADDPLTERDLSVGRQAWKVALEAARNVNRETGDSES